MAPLLISFIASLWMHALKDKREETNCKVLYSFAFYLDALLQSRFYNFVVKNFVLPKFTKDMSLFVEKCVWLTFFDGVYEKNVNIKLYQEL